MGRAARRHAIEPPIGVAGAFTGLVLQDTYTLGRRIGSGTMGEVYEAAHVRLPGRMAVKILRSHLLGNEAAFARFCREAEIMSAVQNPHIVQVFDFNKMPEGLPYFVMEYLDGVDLEVRLAYAGPLPLVAAVRIVDAVASALNAAHAHGIIHRDLKPANIFLTREEGLDADFVKVIDFGISKSVPPGPRLSQMSDVLGTPEFMAPEQAQGLVNEIDGRTDQFALAAVTYTMLTGSPPFSGHDVASLLDKVIREPHPRLSQFVSWDTTAIQSVLDRALAKKQEGRFDNIMDFSHAFSEAAGVATEVPSQAVVEASFEPPPVRPLAAAATPPVELRAAELPVEQRPVRPPTVRPTAVAFDVSTPPRGIDRLPRGPQRAIALGLALLGLAVLVIYKGWYPHRRERSATDRPAVTSPVQPPAPGAAKVTPPEIVPMEVAPDDAASAGRKPPAAEPAAPRLARRPVRARRPPPPESADESTDIVTVPPSRSEAPSAPASPAASEVPEPTLPKTKGFSIPAPAPLPPLDDLPPLEPSP